MAPISYWEYHSFLKGIDVAIIGCGIVGLNMAIHLKKEDPTLSVAIFERGFLPTGASTRNAGFACFGSLSELIEDMKNQTADEVLDLVERRWRGLLELRKLVGDNLLEYQQLGGYEIFREDEAAISSACLEQLPFFNQQLSSITGVSNTYSLQNNKFSEFGFRNIAYIIKNQCEGQLNTGQMMKALIGLGRNLGVEIFNGFTLEKIEEETAGAVLIGNGGVHIKARKIVLATNGFAKHIFPHLDVIPARNQVIVTEPIPDLPFKGCFHYDRGFFYFRNIESPEGNRILLGGGRHLDIQTEQTSDFGQTTKIQQALEELLHETIFPAKKLSVEYQWSGIMGLGPIKAPIIKMMTQNIGVAVRMGGMGVALGNLVGKEAAEMVQQTL